MCILPQSVFPSVFRLSYVRVTKLFIMASCIKQIFYLLFWHLVVTYTAMFFCVVTNMGSIAWCQRMAVWETKHLVECLEILRNYGRDVTCYFQVKNLYLWQLGFEKCPHKSNSF